MGTAVMALLLRGGYGPRERNFNAELMPRIGLGDGEKRQGRAQGPPATCCPSAQHQARPRSIGAVNQTSRT